jgi:hypothetical protein
MRFDVQEALAERESLAGEVRARAAVATAVPCTK